MKIITKLIILFFASFTTALKISCSYQRYDYNNWGERMTCFASYHSIFGYSPTVTEIYQKFPNETVEGVKIVNQKSHFLPRAFTKFFPNMKEFYMFSSGLTYINRCDLKSYTQLKTFSCYNNRLTKIPFDAFEDLVNLEQFSLSHNRIYKVPNISTMKNLKELYLYNNLIRSFTSDDFSENTKLELISIHSNRLTALDESIFDYLPALKFAYFDNNDCIDLNYPETSRNELEEKMLEDCNKYFGIERNDCS